MDDIQGLKNYFKKLKRIIMTEADLKFFRFSFVKKNKIDDVLCCVYAKLPDSYKKMLKTKTNVKQYNSVMCYGLLTKLLAKKFFLDKSLCVVNVTEVNKLLSSVILSIERDINKIEQNFEGH